MEKTFEGASGNDLLRMTAEVVAAYVSKNMTETSHVSDLIGIIYKSLKSLDIQPQELKSEATRPAISIKKSVTPEYLICLEDGKKLKTLKRHLRSTYNMTPDEYRTKWNLGPDYPMVAPIYAAQRSAFAKEIGLGRGAGRGSRRRSGVSLRK